MWVCIQCNRCAAIREDVWQTAKVFPPRGDALWVWIHGLRLVLVVL